MTRTHRSFTTGERPTEPVTFDIDGETFHALPSVPGSVLVEHTARLMSPDASVQAMEILDIWRDLMPDDEYERFRKFIDDPARNVHVQLLGEMARWTIGAITARPTSAPSPSAAGQSETGATSVPAPPQQGSTPSGPTQDGSSTGST